MAARRERPFRTVGLRMQDFGRKLMRQYSTAQSTPTPAGSPAPSWQTDAQTPLIWNQPPGPIEVPATTALPALIDEEIVPISQAEPVQPQRPVQRGQGAKPTDARLLAILQRHQEQDAVRDQIREQKKAMLTAPSEVQREAEDGRPAEPLPPARPRRGRASFDYVETRTLIPPDEQEKTSQGSKSPPAETPQLARSSEPADDDETEGSRGGEATTPTPAIVEQVQRTAEVSEQPPALESSQPIIQPSHFDDPVDVSDGLPLQSSRLDPQPQSPVVQLISPIESNTVIAPVQRSAEAGTGVSAPPAGESVGQRQVPDAQPKPSIAPLVEQAEVAERITRTPIPSTAALPESPMPEERRGETQTQITGQPESQAPVVQLKRLAAEAAAPPEITERVENQQVDVQPASLNDAPAIEPAPVRQAPSQRIDRAMADVSDSTGLRTALPEPPARTEVEQRTAAAPQPTPPVVRREAETASSPEAGGPALPSLPGPPGDTAPKSVDPASTSNEVQAGAQGAAVVQRLAEAPAAPAAEVLPAASISDFTGPEDMPLQSSPMPGQQTVKPAEAVPPKPEEVTALTSPEAKANPPAAAGLQREVRGDQVQRQPDFPAQEAAQMKAAPVDMEALPDIEVGSPPVEAPRVQASPEAPPKALSGESRAQQQIERHAPSAALTSPPSQEPVSQGVHPALSLQREGTPPSISSENPGEAGISVEPPAPEISSVQRQPLDAPPAKSASPLAPEIIGQDKTLLNAPGREVPSDIENPIQRKVIPAELPSAAEAVRGLGSPPTAEAVQTPPPVPMIERKTEAQTLAAPPADADQTPVVSAPPAQKAPAAPAASLQRTVVDGVEAHPGQVVESAKSPQAMPQAIPPSPAPSAPIVQRRAEEETAPGQPVSPKAPENRPVSKPGMPVQRAPEVRDSALETQPLAERVNVPDESLGEAQLDVFEALVNAGMATDEPPTEPGKTESSTISRKPERPGAEPRPTPVPPDTQVAAAKDVFEALAEAGMIPSPHIARKPQPPAQEAELDLLNLLKRQPAPQPMSPATVAQRSPLAAPEAHDPVAAQSGIVMRDLGDNVPASQPAEPGSQALDVDVEQLARDVYNSLRNRLRIERERRG